ncbi:MAG: holo-ACP synthase [Syntrophobacteraceae bacterium]
MSIYGVGIDLVQVERIRKSLERWGSRFEERVFAPGEIAACQQRKDRAGCLAMRFAAKEAFVKALGTGMRPPLRWRDIEVRNDHLGRPEIVLADSARELCRSQGIRSWHLSLTDDGAYSAAVVVLEK